MRFLHIADMHFDAPFASKDALTAKKLREEQLIAFRRAVEYCDENGIPLVLVAGDMFDCRYASVSTAYAVCDIMRSSSARFVIAPGNHDPYTEKGIYDSVKFPENAAIFRTERISKISIPDLNTDIYGFAFTGDRMETSPLGGSLRPDPRSINILLCHGSLNDADSPYCPITAADISASGCDYAALGHIHKGDREPLSVGRCYYAYSGCLMGRSFDECGEKGGLDVTVEKDTGVLDLSARFVRFSDTRYEAVSVDVTGCLGDGEAAERIRRYIDENRLSDAFLRVTLTGNTDPEVELSERVIEKLIGAERAEVRDATLPVYDTKALESDLSLRGAFYRSLLPKLKSEDIRERETAERALRYGMEALDK